MNHKYVCISIYILLYRTHGTHKGLDIVCNDGATVYAPFDVKLNGKAFPYGRPAIPEKLINEGVNLSGEGWPCSFSLIELIRC